jgi:hypothetical protein
MASMTAFSKVRTFEPKEMNLEQMLQVNRALWCMISTEKSAIFWIKFSLSKWRGVVIASSQCVQRRPGRDKRGRVIS